MSRYSRSAGPRGAADRRRRRTKTRLRRASNSTSRQEDARPGSLARGAAVIKSFWKHAPNGPGVYRMIGADGEVLYVGKARSIKKRVASYTRPDRQATRIARMIAQTASMVFVSTESGGRSAAARGQFHQADEAALQRAAARRQELPVYPDHRRSRRAAPAQASRRARPPRATISARSPAPAR